MKKTNHSLQIKIFFTIFIMMSNSWVNAQSEYKQILTHENMQRLEKHSPLVYENRMQIEEWIAAQLENGLSEAPKGTIPIVVHILYNNEEQRISPEQVYSQMEALNRDFNERDNKFKHDALEKEGFEELIAEVGIEFCLTNRDEGGRGSSGIQYQEVALPYWSMTDDMKFEETGGVDAWNTQKFLNIWVVDLEETNSGYAQMPGGSERTDGIVIDYRFFGMNGTVLSPFDEGKTLTHLIGNYLGLYSLWGYTPCTDDYVEDTPIHNDPNFGCFGYRHITACNNKIEAEMTMNFMDSSNDACTMMFTKGQVARMHRMLSSDGPRASLLEGEITVQCEEEMKLNGNDFNTVAGAKKQFTADKETLLNFYPNPVHTSLQIDIYNFPDTSLQLTVYNASGQVVYEQTHALNSANLSLQIDCSDWAVGAYYAQAQSNQYSMTHRLIVSD